MSHFPSSSSSSSSTPGRELQLTTSSTALSPSAPLLSVVPFGPALPGRAKAVAGLTEKNVLSGHVESIVLAGDSFEAARHAFVRHGSTVHPNPNISDPVIRRTKLRKVAPQIEFKSAVPSEPEPEPERDSIEPQVDSEGEEIIGPFVDVSSQTQIQAQPLKPLRSEKFDPANLDAFSGTFRLPSAPSGPTPEALAKLALDKAGQTRVKHSRSSYADGSANELRFGEEKSLFHGSAERDALGRTYMSIPNDVPHINLKIEPDWRREECVVPKKCAHVYKGHAKGVSSIRFLPESGHLLLSASMDGKIKIWDVYHYRKVLRTFIGHNKAVREAIFHPSASVGGRIFSSASYDRSVKIWDTETGQATLPIRLRATPYCTAWAPQHTSILLVGCNNKRIYQFDTRAGDAFVQEYNEHLDAVNAICFIEGGRKFVSSSDDKSLRIWELDLPVTVKHIADPSMHSMPNLCTSPDGQYLLAQSMDNQLLTYALGSGESDSHGGGSGRERFKSHTKRFRGHTVAGYACQPSFSPDARMVLSGDGAGHLYFWSWQGCKLVKRVQKAHDQVVICSQWSPRQPNLVATCSWDATIKLWE